MGSSSSSPIANLPPEILQTVWRNLSFSDLIRCQRVCQRWFTYLPGNDLALHQALFSPLTRLSHPGTLDLRICLRITQHPNGSHARSARNTFNLGVWNLDEPLDHGKFEVHPIVGTLFRYSHLIHPSFNPKAENESFEFYDLEDIKILEQTIESKGEPWESMLACVPKVLTIDIFVEMEVDWHPSGGYTCDGPIHMYRVKNPAGVTVLDVINVVRRALRNLKNELDTYHTLMYGVLELRTGL